MFALDEVRAHYDNENIAFSINVNLIKIRQNGIRTHGVENNTPVFKTGALNHSTICLELK